MCFRITFESILFNALGDQRFFCVYFVHKRDVQSAGSAFGPVLPSLVDMAYAALCMNSCCFVIVLTPHASLRSAASNWLLHVLFFGSAGFNGKLLMCYTLQKYSFRNEKRQGFRG